MMTHNNSPIPEADIIPNRHKHVFLQSKEVAAERH
jgi:hypothetical protein